MKQIGLIVAEAALLLAALFFTLPYVPSNEIERLPLFPSAAFAVALFAGSRLLRWRHRFVIAVPEILAFTLFVWGSNAVANLLYTH